MTTNRKNLGVGLALICVGVYASFMGMVLGDTTYFGLGAFCLMVSCGLITSAVGLALTIHSAIGGQNTNARHDERES